MKEHIENIRIDPNLLSSEHQRMLLRFKNRIIGQDRAVRHVVKAHQSFSIGMNAPNRPITVLLFMGPTGVGKTEIVRALADIIFGNSNCITRIDCAEYQHSHEISKLIGSPPGYLGYSDRGAARLCQQVIDRHQNDAIKMNIVLFDEIEKAHNALFDFLLGILDSGTATLGSGDTVDFTKTILILTSNLGSREVKSLIHDSGIGFRSSQNDREDLDEKIYSRAKEAAIRHFKPEFMNRLDKLVVFRSLSREHLHQILKIEMRYLMRRIISSKHFIQIETTPAADNFVIQEGTSEAYGARELKRAINNLLADPIASLFGSGQLISGDKLIVNYDENHQQGKELEFFKQLPTQALAKIEPLLLGLEDA